MSMRWAGLRPESLAKLYEAGDEWLAACSARPDLVRQVWYIEGLAPIATGRKWLAVEVPFVVTVTAMRRIGTAHLGPILADPGLDLTWWLIPPGTAEDLADVRHAEVQPEGSPLHCPPTGWYQCGRKWLHRPDGTGTLNDPALLAAALGPGSGSNSPRRHPDEAADDRRTADQPAGPDASAPAGARVRRVRGARPAAGRRRGPARHQAGDDLRGGDPSSPSSRSE